MRVCVSMRAWERMPEQQNGGFQTARLIEPHRHVAEVPTTTRRSDCGARACAARRRCDVGVPGRRGLGKDPLPYVVIVYLVCLSWSPNHGLLCRWRPEGRGCGRGRDTAAMHACV
jgi:hypothetical protein